MKQIVVHITIFKKHELKKKVVVRYIAKSAGLAANSVGMVPEKLFSKAENSCSDVNRPISVGKVPENALECKYLEKQKSG